MLDVISNKLRGHKVVITSLPDECQIPLQLDLVGVIDVGRTLCHCGHCAKDRLAHIRLPTGQYIWLSRDYFRLVS
jgi:hypothetical protein